MNFFASKPPRWDHQRQRIERLGRVNLIVGKNNVGKSKLLDALQMYAHRASTSTIISEMMETSQPSKEIICVLVPANGLNREQIIELWDGIASTGLEREVNTALRLIAFWDGSPLHRGHEIKDFL